MSENIVSIQDNEKKLFLSIQNEIEGMVDNKLHTLYQKGPVGRIDAKRVEVECKNQFFGDLSEVLDKSIQGCAEFYELLKHDDPSLYEHLNKELTPLSEKIGECQSIHDLIKLDKVSISQEDQKKIYAIGFKYFKEELLEKAYVYFIFLTLIDPENHHIWLARGMAEQNLGKYADALSSYSSSISLSPGHLIAYLQMMDTLLLMREYDAAQQVYDSFMREVDSEIYSDNSVIVSKLSVVRSYLMDRVY